MPINRREQSTARRPQPPHNTHKHNTQPTAAPMHHRSTQRKIGCFLCCSRCGGSRAQFALHTAPREMRTARSGCRVFFKLQINLICLTRPLNRARPRHTASLHGRRTQMGGLARSQHYKLRCARVRVRARTANCSSSHTRARQRSSDAAALCGADNKFVD